MVDNIKIRRQGWRTGDTIRMEEERIPKIKGSSWEIPQRKISRKTKNKMECIADPRNERLKDTSGGWKRM